MANKKKQHYVPKGYFRLFSPDQINIHLYNAEENISRFIPFNDQCQKPYFYSKDTNIEDTFNKMETAQLNVLRDIKKQRHIKLSKPEDWLHIYAFINLQRMRTKTAKDRSRELGIHLSDHVIKSLILADPKSKELGIDEEMLSKYHILNNSLFLEEIQHVLQASWLLGDLRPVLLINKTHDPFIFSDHPITYYNRLLWQNKDIGVIGIQSTGLQVFCPISNDLLLLLYDQDRYLISGIAADGTYELSSKVDIKWINALQVLNGSTQIFSGKKKGMEIAKNLDKQLSGTEKPKTEARTKSFQRGDEYVEQTMFFEGHIRRCIDLSFMKVLPSSNQLPLIRSMEMYQKHQDLLKELKVDEE